ncbi:MAG: ATP-binding cassette domain-containing protein [Proteobacteria bacterium]|nr:ATP-binding cassette domain-containing protein [Pseudomonadota bacterium]
MIQVENISKSFGDTPLLKNISFSVAPGERIALLGPGGSGKTTILKLILGLLTPDTGSISLMGRDMVHMTSDRERREVLRKVGMAFQQGALFDFMTVRDNLMFAMEHMTDFDLTEMDSRVKRFLSAVKIGRTELMYPYELSGGMQRRVGIVRALATDPIVAFFDEPTAGLDPVTSTIILNMIRDLAGKTNDQALVVCTSNVEIAIRFADRIVMINDGEVVADGPWRQLILSGSPWVQKFLQVRLIGLDTEYALELDLPKEFISQHWNSNQPAV